MNAIMKSVMWNRGIRLMGKALFDENSVFFETLPDQAYPKVLDVDVNSMKKKSMRLLCVVLVCGVLLTVIGFGTNYYPISKYFGVVVLLTTLVYAVILFFNVRRAVSRIVIEENGIYVNNDHYINDGTMKVTIEPFLPFAGLADNIYMKVISSSGVKKYWFGVKGDEKANAARTAVKSALSMLSPSIRLK